MGLGCVGVKKPPSKSLNVQSATPYLSPGSGKAWHYPLRFLLSGWVPHPQVSSYSQGMLTLAPDSAWPSLLLRTCPIHLGPSEKAQSRTEQADPALLTAGSSSLGWHFFRNQLGLILNSGSCCEPQGQVEQGTSYDPDREDMALTCRGLGRREGCKEVV